jgi:hypothetical protein
MWLRLYGAISARNQSSSTVWRGCQSMSDLSDVSAVDTDGADASDI